MMATVQFPEAGDYELQFSSSVADTSQEFDGLITIPSQPVFFRVYNRTDSTYVRFYYYDQSYYGNGHVAGDVTIIFLEKNPRGLFSPTWQVYFPVPTPKDTLIQARVQDDAAVPLRRPV
jgi:hypothetical protein